jgi:hypothetical protein
LLGSWLTVTIVQYCKNVRVKISGWSDPRCSSTSLCRHGRIPILGRIVEHPQKFRKRVCVLRATTTTFGKKIHKYGVIDLSLYNEPTTERMRNIYSNFKFRPF